ncbi:uncharacterized protein EI90DRAFT_316299 [Cantharellus anzutake]|uniref:uncharacterized protein n=1 Tax=Cantharellus anzutake TaxID=1750568 RepID=UPI0019057076|nr:uncharacterized protein EI90DRAFT_316299 [Cantharellus anzutake]KAF8335313.1 hypothetical protein EI90DRAFT_316299 [Cantharellus anzutake]
MIAARRLMSYFTVQHSQGSSTSDISSTPSNAPSLKPSNSRRRLVKRRPSGPIELFPFPTVEDNSPSHVVLITGTPSSSLPDGTSAAASASVREKKPSKTSVWKKALPFYGTSKRFELPIQEPPPSEVSQTPLEHLNAVVDISPQQPSLSRRSLHSTIERPSTAPSAWRAPSGDAGAGVMQPTLKSTISNPRPPISRSRSYEALPEAARGPDRVPLIFSRTAGTQGLSQPSVKALNEFSTLDSFPMPPTSIVKFPVHPSKTVPALQRPHTAPLNHTSVTTNKNPMVEKPHQCPRPLKSSLKRSPDAPPGSSAGRASPIGGHAAT